MFSFARGRGVPRLLACEAEVIVPTLIVQDLLLKRRQGLLLPQDLDGPEPEGESAE